MAKVESSPQTRSYGRKVRLGFKLDSPQENRILAGDS
jgi:hypothetical protein